MIDGSKFKAVNHREKNFTKQMAPGHEALEEEALRFPNDNDILISSHFGGKPRHVLAPVDIAEPLGHLLDTTPVS